MTRYYFHIRSAGQITPDEEGIELPGMIEARLEARLSAGDLAMAAMRGGHGVDGSEIEIADGRGKVLAAIAVRSSLN
jgi:hypothetical protein